MKYHPDHWNDMSNFAVHFTKATKDENDYSSMMHIYSQQRLFAERRFGIGRDMAPQESEQRSVCFSEIPPGHWDRLVERRRTKYGLAFTKDFIRSRGGNPVWYAWKDSPVQEALKLIMSQAIGDPSAPIWKLTPFIDAPGSYGSTDYRFDWEREWRHLGSLPFEPEDVAFLLIPEALHGAAYKFFENAKAENLGPGYFCRYVDPLWSRDRILETLKK
jgi:hypothetical protein